MIVLPGVGDAVSDGRTSSRGRNAQYIRHTLSFQPTNMIRLIYWLTQFTLSRFLTAHSVSLPSIGHISCCYSWSQFYATLQAGGEVAEGVVGTE